jgi:multiple sugar transport system substrate-binding protein
MHRRTLLGGLAALPFAAVPFAAPAFGQTASINYWHHFTSTTEFKGLEQVMALFAKKYPGVKLTQENIPNPEYMAKMTAAVMANARPNVAMVTAERLNDLLGMGALTDLTAKIKSWSRYGEYPEQAWAGCTSGGKIYGIPAFTFVDWMYYRKDWFDEAGLAAPKTMADFAAAAVKLTDPAKGRFGFGMRGGPGGYKFVLDLFEAFGSPIVAGGKPAIDRAKAIQALTFYTELLTKQKAAPASAAGDGYRQIMEGFKTGQTAMVWHHTGSFTEIDAAMKPGTWATAPIPAGPAQQVARMSYQFNGISNAANLDAAWAWLSYWGEPDAAIAFLQETGYFPSSPQVAADPRITANPLYAAAIATTKFGRLPVAFTGVAGWSDNVVQPEFQKALTGRSTPAAAVDAMIAGLEAAF